MPQYAARLAVTKDHFAANCSVHPESQRPFSCLASLRTGSVVSGYARKALEHVVGVTLYTLFRHSRSETV